MSVFRYDTLGQLTAADHTFERNEAYSYDGNGNRTNAGYDTNAGNRLMSDGKYTYTYDQEGNRLTKTDIATGDKEEYAWDHRNRLVSVTFKNSAGTISHQVGYQYDAFDRLVWRADDKTSPFTCADAAAEWFVYDGDDVVVSLLDPDGSGAQASAIAKRYLHGPAVDQILAEEDGDGTDVLWQLTDHLGSVRDLLKNDGTSAGHFQYDSFGNLLDGREALTRYGYAGYERDTATGYYKTAARWYDPAVGRFISEDPSGLGPDVNMYRYVGNGPTNWVDPGGGIRKTRIRRARKIGSAGGMNMAGDRFAAPAWAP